MLARSASSRRRRASRSAASSPQRTPASRSTKSSAVTAAAATTAALAVNEGTPRSRRASVAVSSGSVPQLAPSRSPRNSISGPQGSEGNLLSVSSVANRSARGSFSVSDGVDQLHPGSRSARGSFALPEGFSESLLLPGGGSRSARGSFSVPDIDNPLSMGSRSARGSFAVPEGSDLLLPPQGTRSARGSFSCPNSDIQISISGSRSARASFSVPGDAPEGLLPMNRSPRGSFAMPRGSLVPPELTSASLNPRNSLIPDSGRSPRGSISTDVIPNRSPRGSIGAETANRSPRGSIGADYNRSPRGSIGAEYNRSPRGSIAEHNRSPRGSLGPDGMPTRSPRTSPRGSIPDSVYSPRGSLTAAGLQGSPRGSLDMTVAGSLKGGSHRLTTRVGSNHGDTESRRASSSVSQTSADDRKRLCEQTKLNPEAGAGMRVYGSVVYQLKDANVEASGTCDFVYKAVQIVFKTVTVTVILVCLTAVPVIMLIMGVNYLKDCPKEPNIPLYMVVGGSFGTIKMLWVLWRQIRSRRYQRLDVVQPPPSNYEDTLLTPSAGSRVASFGLSVFLLVWFGLGNYWTWRIFFPAFEPASLYEPNSWCSKTLYIFSLAHLGILYAAIFALLCLTIVLMCCQVFSCSLVVRYK